MDVVDRCGELLPKRPAAGRAVWNQRVPQCWLRRRITSKLYGRSADLSCTLQSNSSFHTVYMSTFYMSPVSGVKNRPFSIYVYPEVEHVQLLETFIQ